LAVDFYQGLERFREPGLPTELPAHKVALIEEHDSIGLERDNLARLRSSADPDEFAILQSRNKLHRLRDKFRKMELKRFQKEWIEERAAWKIVTRGKDSSKPTLGPFHVLIEILPERRRLAELICQDSPMSLEQRKQASLDLHGLCTRDYSVLYRPGEEPTEDGSCPVCGAGMER
jgi:hypothetical protein